ncbi:MAG: hypothetical protein KDK41_15250 [Leptospiraceae bacterium]|nr:hypothetical protein [Leptospiraceae bacterium]
MKKRTFQVEVDGNLLSEEKIEISDLYTLEEATAWLIDRALDMFPYSKEIIVWEPYKKWLGDYNIMELRKQVRIYRDKKQQNDSGLAIS